jgi:hypothetical protein
MDLWSRRFAAGETELTADCELLGFPQLVVVVELSNGL